MPDTEAFVKTELVNSIFLIKFYHPKGNSLPSFLLKSLADAFMDAEKAACRVVILQSEGEKVFCAGASFEELSQITTIEEGLAFFSGFAEVILAMRACTKIIIARVQGKCVGGGVGLAAAADYAIASETSAIKLSELSIGIGPFVIAPAVIRKIGEAAFSQLSIDAAHWRDAAWAREKGLFAEVHSSQESMDEVILSLATKLASYSPEATAELKKYYWRGTDEWETLLYSNAALSGRLILREEAQEMVKKMRG